MSLIICLKYIQSRTCLNLNSIKKDILCVRICLFTSFIILATVTDTWLESILYRWSCTRVTYGRYKKRLPDSDRAKIDERPSLGSLNRQTLRDKIQANVSLVGISKNASYSCIIVNDVMRVIINSERLNGPFSRKKRTYPHRFKFDVSITSFECYQTINNLLYIVYISYMWDI